MNNQNRSVCIRCGKNRIALSTSEEVIGTSTVITTITICPDPECQKKVDALLSSEKEKRTASNIEKGKREQDKKDLRIANRLALR